mmetsp:Transcript_23073/g.60280  ORF Transcript_23073/g.60280 Transcript_23073/m.60280 type:complete len:93 (+) Transcript_23073:144-422(+)
MAPAAQQRAALPSANTRTADFAHVGTAGWIDGPWASLKGGPVPGTWCGSDPKSEDVSYHNHLLVVPLDRAAAVGGIVPVARRCRVEPDPSFL